MTKDERTLLLLLFSCLADCYDDEGLLKDEYYQSIRLFNIDDETFDKSSKKKMLKALKSLKDELL